MSLHSDWPPAGADAGIDYGDMNRVWWEVLCAGREYIGALSNVLWFDFVGDIDDSCVSAMAEDHTLHCSDVGVTGTEVGCEGDDRSIHSRWIRRYARLLSKGQ